MKEHKRRNRSLFQNYLASYVGIAFISCALIGMLLFFFSVHELNIAQYRSTEHKAQLLMDELNNQYRAMQSIVDDVTVDIIFKPTYYRRNKYYEISIVEKLKQYNFWETFIGEPFLVYRDSDSIFHQSGVQTPRTFFRSTLHTEENGQLSVIQAIQTQTVLPLEDSDAFLLLFPVHSLPLRQPYGDIIVCFFVDRSEMLSRLNAASGSIEAELRVFFGSECVVETAGSLGNPTPDWLLRGQAFSIEVYSRNSEYGFVTFLSQLNLWAILFCVIFSLALAVYLAWRSYRPIQDIARRYGNGEPDANELIHLEKSIKTILQRNANISRQIAEQNTYLRRQLLEVVVNGAQNSETCRQLASLGFRTDDNYYIVFILRSTSALSDTQQERLLTLLEDLSDESRCISAFSPHDDPQTIAIVSSASRARVEEAAELINDLTSTFSEGIQITAGDVCESVERISASWIEADIASRCYDSANHIGLDVLGFHYVLARNLVDAASRCDSNTAHTALQEFVHTLETLSRPVMRYSCANLLRMLISANAESHRTLSQSEMNRALTAFSPSIFEEACGNLIDQMIQQIAEEQQRLSQDTSAAIIHYIHQSYANPDLNVAYLVEHFRLPAREINQFCHDQVHASTKEYIITYRIEQAKRKLVEENHSIAEVALEVGYQNISLFIKVFKNKTGVTPSVYRTEARANAVLLPQ